MRNSGCCLGEVTMEVPLTWANRPAPLVYSPSAMLDVTNDLSDDVPPSPTPDPFLPPPPLAAPGTFFQQGFLDCAREAVRFLTEEEGMPQNNPVVEGLRRHLVQATPCYTPPRTSSPCLPSTLSQRGRFAPYTVPSHRRCTSTTSSSGQAVLSHYRREGSSKHCSTTSSSAVAVSAQSSVMNRHCYSSASGVPTTDRIERVLLDNDLISSDDLEGVLKCLGPVPSQLQKLPPSQLVQRSSVSSDSSTVSSSGSLLLEHPLGAECITVKKDCHQCGELNDSGIGNTSCTEVAEDEVDSVDTRCSRSVPESAENACSDSVSLLVDSHNDSALDITSGVDCDENLFVDDCSANVSVSSAFPSLSVTPLPVSSPLFSPSTTEPNSALPSSGPSSQLALLSSLSSGMHQLTSSSSADNSEATASRIQSLASEILLLLQEEAEAQEYEEEDNEEEEEEEEGHASELELDFDDSFELESEP